jgi:ribose transport system substrate-binding protein
MLEIARAGSVPQARIRGMLAGINEVMGDPGHCRVIHLDGDGTFGRSQECMRAHLRSSKAEHTLVGAATDPSALGALRAIEEAGRLPGSVVVGQNADSEGRAELPHKPAPPAVFMKHQLITRQNVDNVYPNDGLLGP